jgi:hypothetical protein
MGSLRSFRSSRMTFGGGRTERCSLSASSVETLCSIEFAGERRKLATHYDTMMSSARAEMIFAAASAPAPAEYYRDVRKSLVERFRRDPYLGDDNAEFFADKCIADWLEQCPLDFEMAP